MMNVKVTSNIYGKTDLTGEYTIEQGTTIVDFTESLKVKWDDEALIVVNNQIVDGDYVLQEADNIYFLTPIVGG